MTAITPNSTRSDRLGGVRALTIALVMGMLLGATAMLALGQRFPTTDVVRPAADTPASVPDAAAADRFAAATGQYVDWFTRDPIGARTWAAATSQYTAVWYARAADLAGSTTATEQYVSWYMRDH